MSAPPPGARPCPPAQPLLPTREGAWCTLPAVRPLLLALCLCSALLPACKGDEPGGIEAAVELAQLDVNPAAPDSNVSLNLTVELQARGQAEEVSLVGLTASELPLTDASGTLEFQAGMVDTETEDPVVRLDVHEARVVRVINEGTTNGELAAWCRLPVQLEVTVETADGEEASATADATVRCP